jgi:type IV pilus assembly protein PilV
MSLNNKKHSSGFTLLEVLVAVLVLSFGLLGIAGLLLASVQNNSVSTQRTTATFLAQDMADRIRSNINATKVKDVNGLTKTAYYLSADVAATSGICFGTASTECGDAQAVAARDLFIWRQQIAASLPAGTGIVCRDSTPDDGIRGDLIANATANLGHGCDPDLGDSPWVIKIFWQVRAEEDASASARAVRVQRYTLMLGAI